MIDYRTDDFNIKELGSFYYQDKTIFRVFAPEHNTLFLVLNDRKIQMLKQHYAFSLEVDGNLEYARYYFETEEGVCFKDPFAYLSKDNYSIVLDTDKFNKEIVKPEEYKDIIIYETSVRDFTSDENLSVDSPKTFLGLIEEGLQKDGYSLGFDYLKDLGITHLQLLPILDFDNDKTDYNWGYNPTAFNYVKELFVKDKDNPYAYINEFRTAVNTLHRYNIRVVLDVVFNHVYDVKTFDIEKMIPGHFLRRKTDGSLAMGTYCGSEIKSEDPFVREYLIEMARRYVDLFDIDGLRMDLMGILDIDTMNNMHDELVLIKNDFIIYGEGWNMGDALEYERRASINNAHSIKNIGMFNDFYRETVIDYVRGNWYNENIRRALIADPNYLDYRQSVNYVECHDGFTLYDRLANDFNDDSEEIIKRKCKLALALVLLSRGFPFIHSGQEFLRSKQGIENTYNKDDSINKIDWDLRIKNNDVVEYFKILVSIRKECGAFRNKEVQINFEHYYECLIYRLDNLVIMINPSYHDHIYHLDKQAQVLLDLNGKCDYYAKDFKLPAHSVTLCKI